jgi:protein phosphatase
MCQGDHLLLCSDGLTTQVSDHELREIILSTSILDIACRRLIDLANARGGSDNVTIVLAKARGEALVPLSMSERAWLETVRDFTD